MNWESIYYCLSSFEIKKSLHGSFDEAFSILLLDEYVLDDPGALYICMDPKIKKVFEKSLIVSIGKCNITAANYIELKNGSVASVFNALVQTENYLNTLRSLLDEAATNQEIITAAGSFLGNPFFYFDESYRVLAISENVVFQEDEEWRYMKTQHFLSPDSIRLMTESGDLDLLAKTEEPVPYKADFFPYTSIVTNIRYQDRPYARLNRLCIGGKVTPVMKEECTIIAKSLKRLLSMRNTLSYSGPMDNMIRDLLNGVQLPEKLIRERMKHLHDFSEDYFRVCSIDVRHGLDEHVPMYYAAMISKIFAEEHTISLIYEDALILILQAKSEEAFDPVIRKVELFTKKQGLRAGFSNVFQRLALLKAHYEQSYAAMEYAEDTQPVFFGDIMTDLLISFIPDSRRGLFYSNDLQSLEDHQSECSFPLIATLKAYLECDCSLQKTAEHLFLHKNTMLYRLNRIKELIRGDLSDPYYRLLLLLSLKMMEKQDGK